ncbi:MAG: Xaa-Pro dipeptidase PepQ [Solirubrobacterales bacterium]|nr:Xaa-Pro dipeptidase PepQ [Solirubrobacterales bacterium]
MPKATPMYDEARLAGVFGEHALDAIVVRSGQNVAYLSGLRFPGTLGRLQDFVHNPRGSVVVQFSSGEATLVVSGIAAGVARQRSWLDDMLEFTEYVDDPYVLAATALRGRGVGRGRIGIERGMMTLVQWETLTAALPQADFVDCTGVLQRLRNVKTPAEVSILKRGADLQDEAYLEVLRTARDGVTERELHARMLRALIERGAESAHGILQSSRNPIAVYGGESDVPVKQGDLLRTDYVSYLDGYAANLSRMAVMGPPTADQEERYALLLDIHREIIGRVLRPGTRACDVHDHYRNRCEAAGVGPVNSLVGHSTGVWWHQEEPMLVPGESQPLQPGMVVCLEPVLEGFWHVQDEVLITEDGSELLSDLFDTDTMFTMGV